MLRDEDRIFTNLYGQADWTLAGARKRGDWDGTAALIQLGRDELVEVEGEPLHVLSVVAHEGVLDEERRRRQRVVVRRDVRRERVVVAPAVGQRAQREARAARTERRAEALGVGPPHARAL